MHLDYDASILLTVYDYVAIINEASGKSLRSRANESLIVVWERQSLQSSAAVSRELTVVVRSAIATRRCGPSSMK